MDNQSQEKRLTALETRLRAVEDQLALCQLIARWGPAADVGDGRAASAIWTEDAVLETDHGRIEGAQAIGEMISGEGQGQLVARGCAHVHSSPVVRIDGDRASAVNYGRVYLHAPEGSEIWRVSVNRWEFDRTDEGWRIATRQVHVIDGGPEAKRLLATGIDPVEGR